MVACAAGGGTRGVPAEAAESCGRAREAAGGQAGLGSVERGGGTWEARASSRSSDESTLAFSDAISSSAMRRESVSESALTSPRTERRRSTEAVEEVATSACSDAIEVSRERLSAAAELRSDTTAASSRESSVEIAVSAVPTAVRSPSS